MRKNSKIYIVAAEGCLGKAIAKNLKEKGFDNLLLNKVDLTSKDKTEAFFKKENPEYVFLPSIKTGGILANSKLPAEFIYQNVATDVNVINSAFKCGVKKMLYLGSACSYPKICSQPIREEYLLQNYLESTNEPYAVAKIAGIKMCQSYNRQYGTNFITAIPTNFYGPEDDFDEGGHVIASLIKKFHTAKTEENENVKIWGSGKPKREFIFVDDVAKACIFLMENYGSSELINIAGGEEAAIKSLAGALKNIAHFKGKIIYENDKPDGIPRRLLDSRKIFKLGWRPKTKLAKGLEITYKWYQNYVAKN